MSGDLFSVAGKIALVTGGANGLGRMIAEGLDAAGCRVLLTSRKRQDAEACAATLRTSGAEGIAVDLSAPEGCAALAGEVRARCDRLDILINNAGRTWGAPLESFPDRGWASVMPVNIQTPFTLVRDLLPLLRTAAAPGAPARVINIGSIAGKLVEPLSAFSYSASKAALHHLTRILAAELARDHVTVNTVIPGYFPTQMTEHVRADVAKLGELLVRVPLRRLGEPSDVVGACIYLASAAGSYVTGSELVLDGGMAGCR